VGNHSFLVVIVKNVCLPGVRTSTAAWSGCNGAGWLLFHASQECVIHFMKILCRHVRLTAWCQVEERFLHVGPGEIRSSHIGLAEIGPLQIGTTEFRLTQVCSVQACFLEMRIAQIGAPQIGMAQVRGSQVCSS